MNATRIISMLLLLLLSLMGCRNGKNNELVERELRQQEDRIYQLKDYIEQYQAMLESSRRENASLRRELGQEPDSGRTAPRRFNPPTIDLDGDDSSSGSSDGLNIPLTPPVIEPGVPSDPDSSDGVAPPLTPGPILDGLPEAEPAPRGEASQLLINPRLTGGLDMNGQPGDEGVMVVVEPRDINGDLVRSEGELSLMIVDPTQEGINGRVARWDFTAAETDAAWRNSLLGQGLHFELPWPADPPNVDRLRLYARLVSPEGQKVLAETDFEVDRLNINTIEEVRPLNGARPQDGFIARAPKNSWSRSDRARQMVPEPVERKTVERKPPVRKETTNSGKNRIPRLQEARKRAPVWKPYR